MTWDRPMPPEYYFRRYYEIRAEIESERLEILIELIARLCRARRQPHSRCFRVREGMFSDATMRWLAERDPIIFATACESEADVLEHVDPDCPIGQMSFLQGLLRRAANPPSRRRRGGDNVGRDVLLIAAMSALMRIYEKPKSAAACALDLYDRLCQVSGVDNDEAIPDPERIRQIWAKRKAFLAKVNFPIGVDLVGCGWSQFDRDLFGIEWDEVLGANNRLGSGDGINWDAV